MGKSKILIPEKLTTQLRQETQNKKHNTICVRHHYPQTNTNNVQHSSGKKHKTKNTTQHNMC